MTDSILGQVGDSLKDLGKDIVKQVVGAPSDAVKTVTQQATGKENSPEEEIKKQQLALQEKARLSQIEAEIAQISAQNARKTGPEIPSVNTEQNQDKLTAQQSGQPVADEASRQAVANRELGKNFKG